MGRELVTQDSKSDLSLATSPLKVNQKTCPEISESSELSELSELSESSVLSELSELSELPESSELSESSEPSESLELKDLSYFYIWQNFFNQDCDWINLTFQTSTLVSLWFSFNTTFQNSSNFNWYSPSLFDFPFQFTFNSHCFPLLSLYTFLSNFRFKVPLNFIFKCHSKFLF